MALSQFIGAEATWFQPGQQPKGIIITDEHKVIIDDSAPHGQAFVYYDSDNEVDLLTIVLVPCQCKRGIENLTSHVLCRVSESVYRDVRGTQILCLLYTSDAADE